MEEIKHVSSRNNQNGIIIQDKACNARNLCKFYNIVTGSDEIDHLAHFKIVVQFPTSSPESSRRSKWQREGRREEQFRPLSQRVSVSGDRIPRC